MDLFQFDCDFSEIDLTPQEIVKILPPWKTKILEINKIEDDTPQIVVKFLIAATTIDEIKLWIKSYENHSLCTYYIRDTPMCKGNHISFKQILNCHHNSRNLNNLDDNKKKFIRKRKRNTNCPSYMKIKLYSLRKRKRYRSYTVTHDPEMPCEIELHPLHNHEIENAEALSWRRVSEDIKEKIIGLFERGHNASTAKDLLKMNICMNYDEYETIIADRKFCPNYNYCAYLYLKYKKSFTSIDEPMDETETINLLVNYLEEFNDITDDDSARFFSYEGNIIICICPPIFRRIHENISIDVIYLDSVKYTKYNNKNNYAIYYLFTNGVSCLLPLGIIIISSLTVQNISNGFEILREMLGENLFGGNTNGPKYVITGDNMTEIEAVNSMWKGSENYLCIYNVMETVYLWLKKPNKSIPKHEHLKMFNMFRSVIFADTEEECALEYNKIVEYSEKYPGFLELLDIYWSRRELWALCYRSEDLKNSTKAALKDQIFERIKDLTIVQALDFYLKKFMPAIEKKILDIANKAYVEYFIDKEIVVPPQKVMERIQKLGEKLFLVPKHEDADLFYIVNLDNFTCTCIENTKPCLHLNWLISITPEDKSKLADEIEIKKLLYFIVTGKKPDENMRSEKNTHQKPSKLPKMDQAVSWVKVKQTDGTIKEVPVYKKSKKVISLNSIQRETSEISINQTTSDITVNEMSEISINETKSEICDNDTTLLEQIQDNWNKLTQNPIKTEVETEISIYDNDMKKLSTLSNIEKEVKDHAKKLLQESTNHITSLGLRAIERNPEKTLDILKQFHFIIQKYKNLSELSQALIDGKPKKHHKL